MKHALTDLAVVVGLLAVAVGSLAVVVALPAWGLTQLSGLPLVVTVPTVATVIAAVCVLVLAALDQPTPPKPDDRFPRPLP